MAKALKKNNFLTFFFFLNHDDIAEQIILDSLETAKRQLHVTHHIALLEKKKEKTKKKHIGSLSLFSRGPGVVIMI